MNKRHGQYTMYSIDTWCIILTMYYPHTPRYAAWMEHRMRYVTVTWLHRNDSPCTVRVKPHPLVHPSCQRTIELWFIIQYPEPFVNPFLIPQSFINNITWLQPPTTKPIVIDELDGGKVASYAARYISNILEKILD